MANGVIARDRISNKSETTERQGLEPFTPLVSNVRETRDALSTSKDRTELSRLGPLTRDKTIYVSR